MNETRARPMPEKFRRYWECYLLEMRQLIAQASGSAVPGFLGGAKEIASHMGRDGVVFSFSTDLPQAGIDVFLGRKTVQRMQAIVDDLVYPLSVPLEEEPIARIDIVEPTAHDDAGETVEMLYSRIVVFSEQAVAALNEEAGRSQATEDFRLYVLGIREANGRAESDTSE